MITREQLILEGWKPHHSMNIKKLNEIADILKREKPVAILPFEVILGAWRDRSNIKAQFYFSKMKDMKGRTVKVYDAKVVGEIKAYQISSFAFNYLGFVLIEEYEPNKVAKQLKIVERQKHLRRLPTVVDEETPPDFILEMEADRLSNRKTKTVVKDKDVVNKNGVYGIYVDNELVYIGYTKRTFGIRWEEHLQNTKIGCGGSQEWYLYKAMREAKTINFKALVIAPKEVKTEKEYKCMEYAAITMYKPKFNYSGVKIDYIWG